MYHNFQQNQSKEPYFNQFYQYPNYNKNALKPGHNKQPSLDIQSSIQLRNSIHDKMIIQGLIHENNISQGDDQEENYVYKENNIQKITKMMNVSIDLYSEASEDDDKENINNQNLIQQKNVSFTKKNNNIKCIEKQQNNNNNNKQVFVKIKSPQKTKDIAYSSYQNSFNKKSNNNTEYKVFTQKKTNYSVDKCYPPKKQDDQILDKLITLQDQNNNNNKPFNQYSHQYPRKQEQYQSEQQLIMTTNRNQTQENFDKNRDTSIQYTQTKPQQEYQYTGINAPLKSIVYYNSQAQQYQDSLQFQHCQTEKPSQLKYSEKTFNQTSTSLDKSTQRQYEYVNSTMYQYPQYYSTLVQSKHKTEQDDLLDWNTSQYDEQQNEIANKINKCKFGNTQSMMYKSHSSANLFNKKQKNEHNQKVKELRFLNEESDCSMITYNNQTMQQQNYYTNNTHNNLNEDSQYNINCNNDPLNKTFSYDVNQSTYMGFNIKEEIPYKQDTKYQFNNTINICHYSQKQISVKGDNEPLNSYPQISKISPNTYSKQMPYLCLENENKENNKNQQNLQKMPSKQNLLKNQGDRSKRMSINVLSNRNSIISRGSLLQSCNENQSNLIQRTQRLRSILKSNNQKSISKFDYLSNINQFQPQDTIKSVFQFKKQLKKNTNETQAEQGQVNGKNDNIKGKQTVNKIKKVKQINTQKIAVIQPKPLYR